MVPPGSARSLRSGVSLQSRLHNAHQQQQHGNQQHQCDERLYQPECSWRRHGCATKRDGERATSASGRGPSAWRCPGFVPSDQYCASSPRPSGGAWAVRLRRVRTNRTASGLRGQSTSGSEEISASSSGSVRPAAAGIGARSRASSGCACNGEAPDPGRRSVAHFRSTGESRTRCFRWKARRHASAAARINAGSAGAAPDGVPAAAENPTTTAPAAAASAAATAAARTPAAGTRNP
jgi:hypothetical protein